MHCLTCHLLVVILLFFPSIRYIHTYIKFSFKFLYFNHSLVHFARYIQLQASPTNRAMCDYHFFNTYFYKKLKEAVSYKVVVSLSFLIFLKSMFPDANTVVIFTVGGCKCWSWLLLVKLLIGTVWFVFDLIMNRAFWQWLCKFWNWGNSAAYGDIWTPVLSLFFFFGGGEGAVVIIHSAFSYQKKLYIVSIWILLILLKTENNKKNKKFTVHSFLLFICLGALFMVPGAGLKKKKKGKQCRHRRGKRKTCFPYALVVHLSVFVGTTLPTYVIYKKRH